eukprot:4472190-Amphidinium_carterae.1
MPLGEKVYVDKQIALNMNLYETNTLTPEFGKLRSRTVMRQSKEQQIDKDLLLRVTSLTDTKNTKTADRNGQPIYQPLLELRSPTPPALRE